MEQNKKYYTPEILELFIGYECEACFSSYGEYAIMDFSDKNKPAEFHPPEDKEKAKFWNKYQIEDQKDNPFEDNPQRSMETAIIVLKDNRLRTQYLSKEQIEVEGWSNIRDVEKWGTSEPAYYWGADYKNAMMGYNPKDNTLVITYRDPCKTIDGTQDEYNYPETKDGQFRGICKSINEFRKICKWIGIK